MGTPMHIAYEEAKKDAEELNIPVTGSEVVGLVPLESLLDAAEFYMKREGLFILHEDQKVHLAINRLGLTTLSPFNARERIIEYCLPSSDGPLISCSVKEFVQEVAARSSAPGGGSVSALIASLGSGLAAMVGQLSYGKRQWESLDAEMRRLIPIFDNASKEMINFVDADTNAFNDYMLAMKMAKNTEEEKIIREKAMQEGLKKAVLVPMKLAMTASALFAPLQELAQLGNINCKSDLQVAVRCLATGVNGAVHNVKINLKDITDLDYAKEKAKEAESYAKTADQQSAKILNMLEERNLIW